MEARDQYIRTWKKYRTSKYWLIGLVISFFPILFLLVKPICSAVNNDLVFHSYGLLWLALTLYFAYNIFELRCPRCHQPFNASNNHWYSYKFSYFADQCVNCGFPKWKLEDGVTDYDDAT